MIGSLQTACNVIIKMVSIFNPVSGKPIVTKQVNEVINVLIRVLERSKNFLFANLKHSLLLLNIRLKPRPIVTNLIASGCLEICHINVTNRPVIARDILAVCNRTNTLPHERTEHCLSVQCIKTIVIVITVLRDNLTILIPNDIRRDVENIAH